jgi:hypothetical protein
MLFYDIIDNRRAIKNIAAKPDIPQHLRYGGLSIRFGCGLGVK